jgi:hypothetical protein
MPLITPRVIKLPSSAENRVHNDRINLFGVKIGMSPYDANQALEAAGFSTDDGRDFDSEGKELTGHNRLGDHLRISFEVITPPHGATTEGVEHRMYVNEALLTEYFPSEDVASAALSARWGLNPTKDQSNGGVYEVVLSKATALPQPRTDAI